MMFLSSTHAQPFLSRLLLPKSILRPYALCDSKRIVSLLQKWFRKNGTVLLCLLTTLVSRLIWICTEVVHRRIPPCTEFWEHSLHLNTTILFLSILISQGAFGGSRTVAALEVVLSFLFSFSCFSLWLGELCTVVV
jgi:hypothetical protein